MEIKNNQNFLNYSVHVFVLKMLRLLLRELKTTKSKISMNKEPKNSKIYMNRPNQICQSEVSYLSFKLIIMRTRIGKIIKL